MKIVNPSKLADYRCMVDADIASVCLSTGKSRPQSYRHFIADQLDGMLLMNSGMFWWSGVIIPRSALSSPRSKDDDSSLFQAAMRGGDELDEKAAALVRSLVFSRHPENVATACILSELDSAADLYFDNEMFGQHYPGHGEWYDMSLSLPFSEFVNEDLNPNLFESQDEYESRVCMNRLAIAMRRMISMPDSAVRTEDWVL